LARSAEADLGRPGASLGDARLFGVLPCLAKLIAVTEPEHAADEKQDDLVEWPWHGGKPECAAPTNWSGDPAIPNDNPHGANGSGKESPRR
jgi:hypothetical protein